VVSEGSALMVKIKGLDKLQRDLRRAQDALTGLDGELGSVSFNPEDPASIDQAIMAMEKIVDEHVAGYDDSEIIGSLSDDMKEQYRAMILEKAAEARLKDDE
jgi:hypothetical protein